MARSSVSDEEIQLRKRARRRLVGAVALVIVAVAAVPLLLDAEPRGNQGAPDVTVSGTSPAPFPTPISEPAAVHPEQAPPSAPALLEDHSAAQPSPPAVSAEADRQPADTMQAESGAAVGKTSYVVQLIATTSPEKARDLKRTLQQQKFPVFTEKTPDGGKIRVRVGPFAQQEAAEAARGRLVELGFDPGKVVSKGD